MKETIKDAKIQILSESGIRPGGILLGILSTGHEGDFMFQENAATWVGRRKSRQVFKKRNVALSLRVDGCFKLTVNVNPKEDSSLLEDETLLFEQLDEGVERMKEMVSFLSRGLTPGGRKPSAKKGGGRR